LILHRTSHEYIHTLHRNGEGWRFVAGAYVHVPFLVLMNGRGNEYFTFQSLGFDTGGVHSDGDIRGEVDGCMFMLICSRCFWFH